MKNSKGFSPPASAEDDSKAKKRNHKQSTHSPNYFLKIEEPNFARGHSLPFIGPAPRAMIGKKRRQEIVTNNSIK